MWIIEAHPKFEKEALAFSSEVREELAAHLKLLAEYGPKLGRPHVDTLNNSKYANMKELRFKADDGVWRIAFAFDPDRKAILLVGGDKSGISSDRFYKNLLKLANKRFKQHLEAKEGKGNG